MESAIGACSTVHHGHMPEIELTGPDETKGIWAMEDIVKLLTGEIPNGHGHYHEIYRKVEDSWRIATLHLSRLRGSAMKTV